MRKRPLAYACLLITLLFYLAVNLFSPMAQGEYRKGKVSVTGRIYQKELRMQADQPVLVLYLKDLSGASPPGKAVMCYLKSGQAEPEMGSRVTVEGSYKTFERASNPGQFDSYSYYLVSGISYRLNQAIILEKTAKYSKVGEGLYRVRRFLSDKLTESLAEEESALMRTILLGEKWGLDQEIKELYQRNGIAHILAISGLHVSMLGMGLYHLLRKGGISMKLSAVSASALLILYGMMTGFSVSALRAILMFSLHMLAVVTERTYDMLTALSLAAVILLITQPLYVNYSGFVFSFGCVLGIGVLTPVLAEGEGGIFQRKKSVLTGAVKGALSACSMGIVTLPIYLWYYYQFPLWSVLLNLLVIPLMSYLMAAGILLLTVSIICPSAVYPLTALIRGIFKIFELTCAVSEKLPAHLVNFGRPQAWQMFFYLAVLLFIILMKKKLILPIRWLAVCFAVLILLVRPGGELEITFLDVGQGDGIYVETAKGERFLIDGGSSSVSNVGKYRLIPFLQYQGTRRLDAVFVTHPDIDHCNGIKEILEQGPDSGIFVEWLVLPDIKEETKSDEYKSLEKAAQQNHVPITYISRGQKIQRGELIITCLHPQKGYEAKEANEYSIVLELTYRNLNVLLTGDLEGEGEQSFLEYQKKKGRGGEKDNLTILKVAHHGSKFSTPREFIETMNPSIAIISAGKDNSYGHPHEELLERLREQKCHIYQTSESGAVMVKVRKGRVWVEEFLDGFIKNTKNDYYLED